MFQRKQESKCIHKKREFNMNHINKAQSDYIVLLTAST